MNISQQLFEDLIDMAMDSPDKEIVGIAAGINDTVTELIPLTNVSSEKNTFKYNSDEYDQVLEKIGNQGQHIIALFYSHSSFDAAPAQHDIKEGRQAEIHLVVSTADEHAPDIQAWMIENGEPFPVEFILTWDEDNEPEFEEFGDDDD